MLGDRELDSIDNNEKHSTDSDHEDADEIEKCDDECDQQSQSDDNDDGDSTSETEWSADFDGADNHVFDEKKARRSLAKLFCKEAWPPHLVDSVHFKEILSILNPEFEITGDNFRSDCLEFFEEEKAKIKHILRNSGGRISLSIDILKHKENWYASGYDYLCLKAHFIDDCWKLKSWILSYFRIWHPKEMATDSALEKSLSEWGIEGKVSTITMGNDFIHDDISGIVKELIQAKNEFWLNGRLFRVYCCADILSRMVQDAFGEISNEISNIRQIVTWGKSLPLWYLTLDMLQEALRLEAKGEFNSSDDYEGYDIPSPKGWKKVQGVCKLVDIIYNVAQVLFDRKNSTAPMYLHSLWELRANLTKESRDSNRFVSYLAKKLVGKLEEYWKNMFLVLSITTVMDPRCKMKFVEFSLSKYEGDDHNSEVTIVLEALHSLFNDYATPIPERDYCASDLSSSESDEEECQNSKNDIIWLKEYDEFVKSSSQPPKSELDLYMEEPVVPWSHDFSALSWWRAASPRYPALSKMAQDFLAIPISLVTSFEAYYTTERHTSECIVSEDRDITNALMCTHSWFQRH